MPTQSTINWGKVVKGAAVVTAVVVAAYVTYTWLAPAAIGAVSDFVGGSETLKGLIASATETAVDIWDTVSKWFVGIGADIKDYWKDIPTKWSLESPYSGQKVGEALSGLGEATRIGSTAVVAGAGVAGASHFLSHTDFVSHHAVASHAHDMGHHASHVATERAMERKPAQNWQTRVGGAPAAANFASHADAVRASKPVESTYAEQMKTETAALDKALAK